MFERVPLGNGADLALDWTPPRAPGAATLVYLHGFGSHRGGEKARYLEQELTARGFGYARFDFRGHGDSGGSFESLTLTRQLEDVAASFAHLAKRLESSGGAANTPRFVPIGSSLGGLTAAWHSLLHPDSVRAQILIAPAFKIIERYLAAIGDAGRERWQREGRYRFVGPWFEFELDWSIVEDARRYPYERLVRESRTPTLIVHGTRDESVPFRLSADFAGACASMRPRLVAIEGGDHRLTAHKERLVREILAFLDELDDARQSAPDRLSSGPSCS